MEPFKEDLIFSHIPSFARYIIENYLEEFAALQIHFSRETNSPIFGKLVSLPYEALLGYTIQNAKIFLASLAENKAREQLEASHTKWKQDQLGIIGQDQLELDDVLIVTAMRKKAFLAIIKKYTSDAGLIIELVSEADRLFLAHDRASANTYVTMMKNKIDEEGLFKQKLPKTSPGFYYIYDIPGDKQVLESAKLFDMLGYSKKEYAGNNRFFRSIMHPVDLKTAETYLNVFKDAKEGETRFFEYRLKTKDGHYRWMRNYESVFKRDHNNIPVQLIGVAFDNSQEHFIKEELKQREEELLDAQNLAQMGSYVWDFTNNSLKSTPQTISILGLDEQSGFDDLVKNIHPTDKPRVLDAFRKAIADKEDFECEYRCIVNGEEKIIWSRGKVFLNEDQPPHVKATVMDVTDKHHMVQKLQRSEELYKQAQALNKIGNWSWLMKTDTLNWSDELYRIYGLEPQSEKVDFERFFSFVHPDDKELRAHELREQLSGASYKDYYFRIITADNKEKILHGQSEVLTDENGDPYKIIGTCQDVTEQKMLEKALTEKTVQLEKSNASLQVFAYISSHDLKEPLRKISMLGDRLRILNRDKLDDPSTSLLNKMISSSLRLQRMIDEILSISRINSDERFEDIDLQKLLEEVLRTLEHHTEEYLAIIKSDGLPTARVNKTQFHQLFVNLISNSLKFRKNGIAPEITINHDYLSADETKVIGLNSSKKWLRIRFTDNGIGFDNEYNEKIFALFQRLHSRGIFEGTGIGLAICKEIVNHHQGIIRAHGLVGVGATFTIIIPVTRD